MTYPSSIKEITLAYGDEKIGFPFRLPPDQLTIREPEKRIDDERFIRELNAALDTIDADLSAPMVVVADKTRLCGYPQYLPLLLDTLSARGARTEKLTIWIAYGTHASQSVTDSRTAYGAALGRCTWVHHRCDATEGFVELGVTCRGTPIRLPKRIAEAGCLITFGAISHHYFAGYGGGRKLIFPGLGEKHAIYANHGLFLDRQARRLAPGCRPGVLDGNPLAEDLAEIENARPADLAIHGILNSYGRVCDLLVGHGPSHFAEACARYAANTEIQIKAEYDLVLASCGGFPKDINFIQSHKAVHHAADFVRDGGRLIVLAQCRDGVGSHTFLPWFDLGSQDAAFERLAADYQGNGGTALAMMAKTERIRIDLVTELPKVIVDRIGCGRLTPEESQRAVAQHCGSLAVIPNAGLLVRKVMPP
jgi:nickel-dependent lactate racemase